MFYKKVDTPRYIFFIRIKLMSIDSYVTLNFEKFIIGILFCALLLKRSADVLIETCYVP